MCDITGITGIVEGKLPDKSRAMLVVCKSSPYVVINRALMYESNTIIVFSFFSLKHRGERASELMNRKFSLGNVKENQVSFKISSFLYK